MGSNASASEVSSVLLTFVFFAWRRGYGSSPTSKAGQTGMLELRFPGRNGCHREERPTGHMGKLPAGQGEGMKTSERPQVALHLLVGADSNQRAQIPLGRKHQTQAQPTRASQMPDRWSFLIPSPWWRCTSPMAAGSARTTLKTIARWASSRPRTSR